MIGNLSERLAVTPIRIPAACGYSGFNYTLPGHVMGASQKPAEVEPRALVARVGENSLLYALQLLLETYNVTKYKN